MSHRPGDAIGSRREARETALGLLYAAHSRGVDPLEVLTEQPVTPEHYTVQLVEGVAGHIQELDDLIGNYSEGWSTGRMPAIDLVLIRMAVYELAHQPEVPASAVLSELVELVGESSTEKSGKFVNGVVARIAEELRPGS